MWKVYDRLETEERLTVHRKHYPIFKDICHSDCEMKCHQHISACVKIFVLSLCCFCSHVAGLHVCFGRPGLGGLPK